MVSGVGQVEVRASITDARIYACTVRHVRRAPVGNEFTYPMVMWLVDLDHLPRIPRALRMLAEFRAADHCGDPALSLRRNVDEYLATQGIDLGGGRVSMLAAPRSFGHVFNPLTVYWCRDREDRPICVIAEVHNTYGDRHRYLLRPDEAGFAATDKDFYVSPFFPVAGRYRMSLPEPGAELALAIRYDPPDAPPFTAELRGHVIPAAADGAPAAATATAGARATASATTSTLLHLALRRPCPTLMTSARIRMQGIKLFARGLPVVPRLSVADRLARLYREATGGELPVGVRAWDGSETGPAGEPTLVLTSSRALRRMLWAPNELGLAQAYVTGELDVEGDVAEALRRVWASAGPRTRAPRISSHHTPNRHTLIRRARALPRLLTGAFRLGALGPRPTAPATQVTVRGGLHTPARDRAVIAHHYDLSNDFYALLLDPSMSYSSADWTSADPGYALADAQRDKLDLICRKLQLRAGMRLLDVGCGWGGLLMHAAEHYGVHGVGLTLSREQAAYIAQETERRGLTDRVEVRVEHFREFQEPGSFDAVASVEMGEHVGAAAYPAYVRMVHASLRPGGLAVIQQMSRAQDAAPGGGAFIEAFIAPDMHMRPVEQTAAQWTAAGFALLGTQCLRTDYVRTIAVWRAALEDTWPKAVELVGEETARVWRLYLAGGQVAFEQGRMGVDQILLSAADDRSDNTVGDDGDVDDGH